MVPAPGRSLTDQIEDGGMVNQTYLAGLGGLDSRDCRQWIDDELARSAFYADCDHRIVDAAIPRLRPQAWAPYRQRFPLDELPEVGSTSIICTDDQVIYPDWSKRVAPETLGADVVELPGGHSPFLSRPAELAEVLVALA
jgi:pimeloyl-ACP methyl ester carboxylesterase